MVTIRVYEQPDLYNADCMDGMKEFPDNFFDLAIVDPPYGGANSDAEGGVQQDITPSDCGRRIKATRTGGTWAEKYAKKSMRGTLPRRKNTSKNCSVFHAIKLFGAVTTSTFHLQGAS